MDAEGEIKTKECALCMVERPLNMFASHIDAKSQKQYFRNRCRTCEAAKRNEGKVRGIMRHLTPTDVQKIKANGDLFGKVKIAKFYQIVFDGVVPPSVSTSVFYTAVKKGEIAAIIQG